MEFEAFVNAELGGWSRFAAVLCGGRQLAHDVVADAVVAAAGRWSTIGPMDHPAAYVRRMIVTTYLADRRKTARRKTFPTAEPEPSTAVRTGGTAAVDVRVSLQASLRELPPQQRAAVVLRYYLDLDDAAIAAIVGTSPSGVRSNISRALARLRIRPDLQNLQEAP